MSCPITRVAPDSSTTVTKPSCSDNVRAARRANVMASSSDNFSCVDSGQGPHCGIVIVACPYIITASLYKELSSESTSENQIPPIATNTSPIIRTVITCPFRPILAAILHRERTFDTSDNNDRHDNKRESCRVVAKPVCCGLDCVLDCHRIASRGVAYSLHP